MKYLINGSVGDLSTKNNGSFSGVTIVEANQTYFEFHDPGSGNRYFASYPEFNGFDATGSTSRLNSLVRSGATLKQGASVVGTLRGYRGGFVEYEDTGGAGHAYSSPLFFTIL